MQWSFFYEKNTSKENNPPVDGIYVVLGLVIAVVGGTLIEHITDMEKVMNYGVMSMPAIVVNDKVVSMGKVLKPNKVEALLKKSIG